MTWDEIEAKMREAMDEAPVRLLDEFPLVVEPLSDEEFSKRLEGYLNHRTSMRIGDFLA